MRRARKEEVMQESQVELRESIYANFMRYRELRPEFATIYDESTHEAYKNGALEAKIKRLMALCGALVSGCRACILSQTERALQLGASKEEILETCGVAISLGGTMAAGETTRVVQYLDETGKL